MARRIACLSRSREAMATMHEDILQILACSVVFATLRFALIGLLGLVARLAS